MKTKVYPCKTLFYYIIVGFRGSKWYKRVLVMQKKKKKKKKKCPTKQFNLAYRYIWRFISE